uniref:RING-type domain-containing protein n=2 Tax=Daucus carota subsp. sativus TaxID=79200 RepID=A0A175YJD6_DAUCS
MGNKQSRTRSQGSGPHFQPTPQANSRYARIGDDYSSLEQVTEALARAGLESSNLIVGIDFTKSNEWTGARSYQRRSLHHLGDSLNPYEQAISIIGRTLSVFDEDNLIPCYGFGDDDKPCTGFEEALTRYREIVPQIRLAGPTSFAPIIETAIGIVNETGGQYHVLLIIADGQVTRSVDTNPGQLSPQEQSTIAAIVEASKYPLSIILVGVGDGPWDVMVQFDDNIPARAFDNFQFVNFTEIMSKNVPLSQKETEFALAALMEIPSQYKATLDFQLLRYHHCIYFTLLLSSDRPTSFAPIIETAIGIVNETGGQYHVLLIIADGQVTRSVDTNPGQLSPQEQSTIAAIVEASKYPLSIILVGVGDGPWDVMVQFDDNIPARAFDNFQFVNFTEIMSKNVPLSQKETEFALAALMEIPSQYKATLDFQLLSNQRNTTRRHALPPPIQNSSTTTSGWNYMQSPTVVQGDRMYYTPQPPSTQNILHSQGCPICSYNIKDLAFGCGHQACYECGKDLLVCPECDMRITTKIRLYG